MDIEETRRIDWADVTTYVDNTQITAPVGYNLELVNAAGELALAYPPIGTPLLTESYAEINFGELGVPPGDYVLYARAQVTRGGVTRVSARSNGVPLALQQYLAPSAPAGLRIS